MNKNTPLPMIYQAPNGAIEINIDIKQETFWATQAQIAELFGIDRTVVTKHIRNILRDAELDERSVCANFAHTAEDGKTYQVQFYNLDIMLAVGYRTKSARATRFRQWATQTLKQHITEGYTINPARITANYDVFMQAVADIRALLPAENIIPASSVLDVVTSFAETWLSLDAYDREAFVMSEVSKKTIAVTADELRNALDIFKHELIQKGEATDLFSQPKEAHSLESIIANVFQSFDDEDVYPTIVEKAAHLLYFLVKNHIFVDGNKRSGAFAFVWFLEKAGCLDRGKMNPQALTALTLLIAESHPRDKDKMVGIVGLLLR